MTTRRPRRVLSEQDYIDKYGVGSKEHRQKILDQITLYGAIMRLPKNFIVMSIGQDSEE